MEKTVFTAGVHGQLWLLLLIVVIGSGIGLFYYLRIVLQMSKQVSAPTENHNQRPAVSTADNIALSILTALIFWFGLFPGSFIEWIASISL